MPGVTSSTLGPTAARTAVRSRGAQTSPGAPASVASRANAGTCVAAGLWQLDRLASVRAENARVASQLTEPAVDLTVLADPASAATVDQAALEFRRVTVTGSYHVDEEVLQRGQQYRNEAGFDVLTPLELTDGGVVLVRRGWVPSAYSQPPVADAAPPTGDVTVTGVLERPVPQPSFGPRDPDDGQLDRIFNTDTTRLDRQITGSLFPMVLRIDTDPASIAVGSLPVPPGPPTLDERNHFSYAVQWFSFATLAVVTYGAWLVNRRRMRGGGSGSG
jgi:surfeit locus 1 family protein